MNATNPLSSDPTSRPNGPHSVRRGRGLFLGVLSLAAQAFCFGSAAPSLEEVDVFVSGTEGYATYRIPAIVPTTSGTLLAFCEGRRNGAGDSGAIDLLLRRSFDEGRTWGPIQLVWRDGDNTCGNPAPVVDRETGRVWLFTTWNLGTDIEARIHDGMSSDTRRVFVTSSQDDGASWAPVEEVTSDVKAADWRWYATGPGHAIQLSNGRLVIPANHSRREGTRGLTSSHVIVSDDSGRTWCHTEEVGGHTNESTVAELDDGRLYLNMRSYRGKHARAFAWSEDRGDTWGEVANDPVLIEPVCQGSVLRYPRPGQSSLHLFSNPASKKRVNMTVRVSTDACRTWNAGRVVYAGPSAYSDLCPLKDDAVGLLYERDAGGKPYGRITFTRLPLEWLLAAPEPGAQSTTTSQEQIKEAGVMSEADLPALPDPHGVAGAFAGRSSGALIVAGGANFPAGKPWEGGKKVWHDSVYVLPEKGSHWSSGERLPRPLAYGVSVTIPEGLLCVGGEDANGAHPDVFLLTYDGTRIVSKEYPKLPVPLANGAGVVAGNRVYLLGGNGGAADPAARRDVFRLDLANVSAGWTRLDPWPGSPRILPVAAEVNGRVYLCSGADVQVGADGKPVRTYLRDAYCYEEGAGWSRLADLPRAAVAAPSPAPTSKSSGFVILGGDDGRMAGVPASPEHPGFPRTVLRYEIATDSWREEGELRLSRVTVPAVAAPGGVILPSGEIRPGVRTPEVSLVKVGR